MVFSVSKWSIFEKSKIFASEKLFGYTTMTHFILFGCGAINSQIALHLAQPENSFTLIDDDRVSRNNVITGTSTYSHYHIGAMKAVVLAEMLYQKARCDTTAHTTTLTTENENDFIPTGECIAIDAFDNMQSRALTRHFQNETGWIPALHVGVTLQRTGSILWDEHFHVPNEIEDRYANPICTNVLGASILRLTSAIAVSVLEIFIQTGEKRNYLITESLQLTEINI